MGLWKDSCKFRTHSLPFIASNAESLPALSSGKRRERALAVAEPLCFLIFRLLRAFGGSVFFLEIEFCIIQ